MDHKDARNLLERFRTDIHAVADLICDIVEMKMLLEYNVVPAKEETARNDSRFISAPVERKKRDVFTLFELTDASSSILLKQAKPTMVTFPDGKMVITTSWKALTKALLKECADIPECKEKMLRSALTGTPGRTQILASDPSEFPSPLKITEGLYFNSLSSKKAMLTRLKDALDTAGYDYSSVQVKTRLAVKRQKELPDQVADKVPLDIVYKFSIGRKPVSVTLPDGMVMRTETWVDVARILFADCCEYAGYREKLETLADHFYSPNGLNQLSVSRSQLQQPVQIGENLYLDFSGSRDVSMARIVRLLDAVGYDYSDVTLQLKERYTEQGLSDQQIDEESYGQDEDGPVLTM